MEALVPSSCPDCVPPAAALDLPFAPAAPDVVDAPRAFRPWLPDRAQFTPAALAEPWGEQIRARVEALGVPVEVLGANRLVGLRGRTERETYRVAKRTLSVVAAPDGQLALSPIPPSADWQFHLAQGCPAHCQYCYLAGSLQGPPTVRVYANLPRVLDNLAGYVGRTTGRRAAEEWGADAGCTSFEASCYTDPLGIEHLTGSLAEAVAFFGTDRRMARGRLRWTTKFSTPAAVAPLLALPHGGRTRARVSVNADRWRAASRAGGAGGRAPRRRGGARRGGLPAGARRRAHHAGRRLARRVRGAARRGPPRAAARPARRRRPDGGAHHAPVHGRQQARARGVVPEQHARDGRGSARREAHQVRVGEVRVPAATMRAMRAWFAAELAARWPRARVLYWT
jgi:spore photoproduct lyase